MDQLPAQTVIMGRGSILGLVFALFIASVQAKINNDCHLVDDDGSPVGDISKYSSRNETTGWVGEPDTRGSMTIVTTCIVTLGLCVWTSIHVNVQIDRLSFYRLRRKVATSVKALIFPNLVVESAHDEWAEMTRLYEGCANLRKIMDDNKPKVLPVEKPKDAARQEESEKDPIEIASCSPIPEATTYSSTSPEPAQSTPINMSPDAASQGSSNGGSPKSTWFKRVIGMAEKPEDPDYPFSKEVCFFVVMGGFVRPGRENALPTASGHATAPQSHQMPPPANETLTKRKQKKLANANSKLTTAEKELDDAKAELNNINANTSAKVKSKAERKLAKAEARLAQARAKLAKARLPIFKITPEDFFNAYARNPDKFRRLIKSREKDILDKGNASNIAKLIIMAQVTKLVLQMIGRKAMKLSVSVLELHIFCHILIAGLLYSYWWYKQLDVNEPMVLDIGDRYWAPDPMWSYYPERALPPTRFVHWQNFWKTFDPLVWFGIEKLATAKDTEAKDLACAIEQINAMRFEGKAGVLEPPAPLLAVPKKPAADKDTPPPRSGTFYSPPEHARPGCKPFHKSLPTKAKFESNRRAMWFYIAYAGLHATVWGIENFPTWQEKWLWRGACIAVAVVPAVGAASEYMKYLWSVWTSTSVKSPNTRSDPEKGMTLDATDVTDKEKLKLFTRDWFLGFLTLKYLLEFLYFLASVTLLAESFAILRAEDARTYEIKSWTAELPLGR